MNDVARKKFLRRGVVFFLFWVSVVLFAYTIELRRPWFNTTGAKSTASNITLPLVSAKIWDREGYFHLRGVMFNNPDSIEFSDLAARQPIVSYPPGMLLPVYLISQLTAREPSLAIIMGYNLANHFLIALLLALTVFLLLSQLGYTRWFFSFLCLIPPIVYLLLPGTLYDHQMRFTSHHAVLLYFALYVFLEVLRDSLSSKRLLTVLVFFQCVVAFLGIWTDWFFGFVAVCVYIKRLALGEMGKTPKSFLTKHLVWGLPLVMGLLLFGLQLFYAIGLEQIAANVSQRISTPMKLRQWFILAVYFNKDMTACFGQTGFVLLVLFLLCFFLGALYAGFRRIVRKEPNAHLNKVLASIFMLMGPCFLHLVVFHYFYVFPINHLGVIKFAIPLATVPFVLGPLLLASCFKKTHDIALEEKSTEVVLKRRSRTVLRFLGEPFLLLVLACGYVALEYPGIRPLFESTTEEEETKWMNAFAESIAENTTYEDFVFCFTPLQAIDLKSPHFPIAMKRVYFVWSFDKMVAQVAQLEADCVVCIANIGRPKPGTLMGKLAQLAFERKEGEHLVLDRIHKQDFLKFVEEIGIPVTHDAQEQTPEARPAMPKITHDPNLPGDGDL